MFELEEAQFELRGDLDDETDGILFGLGTDLNVRVFEADPADIRNNDKQRPMGDGQRFGRDFKGGATYSLELNALSKRTDIDQGSSALTKADQFASAWSDDYVRMTPGAVSVLRWKRAGEGRRVYGRPRRCSTVPSHYWTGDVPIVADFVAADDLVYSDSLKQNTVGIVPSYGGGAVWPLQWPILWNQTPGSSVAGTIVVGGSRPTWPVILIHGPVLDPIIAIPGCGEIKIRTNLLYDQYLVLDTRPWHQGVRRDNGANLASVVDRRATSLSNFRLPPGSFQIVLKGTDPTGTAYLVTQWRDAYSSV